MVGSSSVIQGSAPDSGPVRDGIWWGIARFAMGAC
jgi:hypothetical protein